MPEHEKNEVELVRTWVLPPAATLGSSIRAKGILLELRAPLPAVSKKSLVDGCKCQGRIPCLETDTVVDYLQVIGVAGECSTRAFATAEVALAALTTDVLALV
ncbi:hypothetical protein HFN87_07420 [Rhizobium laguerreae]|uniref:hypothetical protein n=1 Tax=Rhizobium laguerreae TaxID=1076926 RepID=UPI001C911C22|nr:hypothetical protein [Rhizobium laguerreae]MBY3413116.1 hypothetical protein [Rhizobium laguerreae]